MPIKQGGFTALYTKHKNLGVVVDLGSIGPYGYAAPSRPSENLIHSDFQSDPWEANLLRYGSGRAGFYRGHYLKGVGRTVLAGNWNKDSDVLHSSGHLRPCAAAREHLITVYMQARGAGDLILGCDGILVKPLDRNLRGIFEHVVKEKRGLLRTADRKFQAISVKQSDFARLSNFTWLADHTFTLERGLNGFFRWLSQAMVDANGQSESFSNAHRLVERVEQMTDLLISRFFRTIELGINWNGYHNNFTLDGRFVDIEGPLVLGQPFIGNLFDRTFNEEFCFPHLGFELIYVLRQLFGHWTHLSARCELALNLGLRRSSPERQQTIVFQEGLRHFLNGKRSLFRKDRMLDILMRFFKEDIGLSSVGIRESERYASHVYDFFFNGSNELYKLPLARPRALKRTDGTALAIGSPNTVQRLEPRPAKFFDTRRYTYDDAERMFDWIERVETQTSLDKFLSELETVTTEIRRTIK